MNGPESHCIAGKQTALYGDPAARCRFLQPVDESDRRGMAEEAEAVRRLAPGIPFCIAAFSVEDWNRELTPWEAPPAFGKTPFGSGARETLSFAEGRLIPELERLYPSGQTAKYALCGYSLAGLFALWGVYSSDRFSGAAAASPSVWYPDWISFAASRPAPAVPVYLSLGDREEKTRNPVMARVGDCIREQYRLLSEAGGDCALEWNPGNHFMDSALRTAKGIAWLLRKAE